MPDAAKPASPPESPPESPEARQAALAPETHNSEQDDESAQAQTLADEALGRHGAANGSPTESIKVAGGIEDGSTQDLVDHMRDMEGSGRIDMGAYAGEETMDDNEGLYGEAGNPDPRLPSDSD